MTGVTVLDAFPEWQACCAQVTRAEEALAAVIEQGIAEGERVRAAQEAYEAALREAVETGGTVPDPPPGPSTSLQSVAVMAQQAVLDRKAECALVLAQVADPVEAEVRRRVSAATTKARRAVGVLTECSGEITTDLEVLARVRNARQVETGRVTRSHVTRSGATPPELVQAVLDGTDLTTPLPVGVGSRVQRFDGSEVNRSGDGGYEERTLGMLPRHKDWPTTLQWRGRLP